MKKKSIIFAIVYLAYTAIYIARLNLSVAAPVFVDLGIADTAQIGLLGSVFSVIYACGRLINGGLGDKVAPYKMICTGLVIASVSNLCIGVLPPFWGIVLLWGANAFAQSMLWSSVLCVVSEIYPEEKAKKMVSYMVTSVATGNIVGIVLNTWVVDNLGVNFAFLIPGGITLVMSGAVLLSTKNIIPEAKTEKKHISVFGLLKNKEILLIIIPALLHGVIKDNISLWMTVYFVDCFGINLGDSANFVLFIPLIGFVGRLIYPALFKMCKEHEHIVSVLAFTLCALFILPLCFDIKSPVLAVVSLSMIYALVSVINTSILSIYPIRYAQTGNVASVSGLMDFATYGGAGIGSLVFGIMIKNWGYSPMYISWVVISVISIAILSGLAFKKKEA
ncbi:MAG: MFS transporter [Clostridia bacterium]|nr:MFS transporter [Clostridia bacterium]